MDIILVMVDFGSEFSDYYTLMFCRRMSKKAIDFLITLTFHVLQMVQDTNAQKQQGNSEEFHDGNNFFVSPFILFIFLLLYTVFSEREELPKLFLAAVIKEMLNFLLNLYFTPVFACSLGCTKHRIVMSC